MWHLVALLTSLLLLSNTLELSYSVFIPGSGCGTTEPIGEVPDLNGEEAEEDLPCTLVKDRKSFQTFYADAVKKGTSIGPDKSFCCRVSEKVSLAHTISGHRKIQIVLKYYLYRLVSHQLLNVLFVAFTFLGTLDRTREKYVVFHTWPDKDRLLRPSS